MLRDCFRGELLLNKALDKMSDEDVGFFLARFVAEEYKQDGEDYPGKTIYEMICSLQGCLRTECWWDLCLIDNKGGRFCSLNSGLNFNLKERAGRGFGGDTNQAQCITPKEIDFLWKKCLLGSINPELLRDVLVFVLGNEFALRAGRNTRICE